MRFSNVSLDWLDWKELARDGLSGILLVGDFERFVLDGEYLFEVVF